MGMDVMVNFAILIISFSRVKELYHTSLLTLFILVCFVTFR